MAVPRGCWEPALADRTAADASTVVVAAEVAVRLRLAVVDVDARNAPRVLLRDRRGHASEEVAPDAPAA